RHHHHLAEISERPGQRRDALRVHAVIVGDQDERRRIRAHWAQGATATGRLQAARWPSCGLLESRGEPIRTADHSHPKRVRYLAAPRPGAPSLRDPRRRVKAHVKRVTRGRARLIACQLFDAWDTSVNFDPRRAPRAAPERKE